jgi:hypothetical protein
LKTRYAYARAVVIEEVAWRDETGVIRDLLLIVPKPVTSQGGFAHSTFYANTAEYLRTNGFEKTSFFGTPNAWIGPNTSKHYEVAKSLETAGYLYDEEEAKEKTRQRTQARQKETSIAAIKEAIKNGTVTKTQKAAIVKRLRKLEQMQRQLFKAS